MYKYNKIQKGGGDPISISEAHASVRLHLFQETRMSHTGGSISIYAFAVIFFPIMHPAVGNTGRRPSINPPKKLIPPSRCCTWKSRQILSCCRVCYGTGFNFVFLMIAVSHHIVSVCPLFSLKRKWIPPQCDATGMHHYTWPSTPPHGWWGG